MVKQYHAPGGMNVRVDSGLYAGYKVPPYYDSMIAKLIVYGTTRAGAMRRLRRALEEFVIEGMKTTIPLHQRLIEDPEFQAGDYTIKWLEEWLSRDGGEGSSGAALQTPAAAQTAGPAAGERRDRTLRSSIRPSTSQRRLCRSRSSRRTWPACSASAIACARGSAPGADQRLGAIPVDMRRIRLVPGIRDTLRSHVLSPYERAKPTS